MADNTHYPVFLLHCSREDTRRITDWLRHTPFEAVQNAVRAADVTAPRGLVIVDGSQVDAETLLLIRHLPVIVLTDSTDGDWTLEAGALDYWPKAALTRDGLLRSLHYAVRRHELALRLDDCELAALEGEARFRSLIVRNSDGMMVVNGDGIVRFVNPAAEVLFGRPAVHLLDSPFGFPITPGDSAELEVLQQPGGIATVEMRVVETDWEGAPSFLLSLRDITERKRTEQQLSLALKTTYQFAAAIASFTIGVVITDPKQPDNPIVFVNAGFSRMTGYTSDEVMGQNWRFLYGPETDPSAILQIEAAVAGQHPTNCTLLQYRKDGSPFWTEMTINPVFDSENQVINLAGLQIDVTLRKQAEQALLEQERLRVALEKEKELGEIRSAFMSTISHEFRTPLAMIQSASDVLDRYYHHLSDQQRHERLVNIQTQVRYLEDMLDEISLVLRAELNRLDFHPVLLDVKQFCQMLVEEIRTTIGVNHQIDFTYEPGVYEMPADPRLLRHILNNLLVNAVKYSGAGTVICFDLFFYGTQVVFRIRDQGIGIPPKDQARLFEPFFRAGNVGAIRGTGLGLKVVMDCVMVHGGTITLDSQEGQGTTATVRLPRIGGDTRREERLP